MTQNNEANQDALLVEYQVCQTLANSLNNNQWAFAGIFFGLTNVAFGLVIPYIFSINSCAFRIFILLISILVIAIIWLVYTGLSALDARSEECYKRMAQIENITRMKIQHIQKSLGGIHLKTCWIWISIILTALWVLAIIIDIILLLCKSA